MVAPNYISYDERFELLYPSQMIPVFTKSPERFKWSSFIQRWPRLKMSYSNLGRKWAWILGYTRSEPI